MATATDPFAATGGGVQLAGGQWVPKNHPLAQGAGTGATGTPAAGTQAAPIPPNAGQTTAAPVPPNSGLQGVTGSTGTSLVSQTGNLGGATATQPGAGGGTIQTQFRDALLGQLSANPNPSLSDPDLAPQARAYQDAQTRSLAEQQRTAAEQGFASGSLHTGAYQTDLGALQQQEGQNIGQFNANLLSTAKQQRMADLFNALGIGQNLLTSDASLQLQNKLGMSDIQLRDKLGSGQLSLGLLQALLGDRLGNNQLGLSAAQIAAGIDDKSLNRVT